ncbi:MAG: hypothetical protein DMF89_16055 [Acidobacteria bacterium]|nr:MAG: hypothetical protein DMF90_17660 [Acidobacteriota bacterium]PYR48403.1 MAG: hypothetical protein DMF89_16055 [Acidobacteriota bacterium]
MRQRVFNRFSPTRLIVEIPQIVLHEGDEPDALADLRHADVLAGEDVAEVDLASPEADAATRAPAKACRIVR